MKLEHGKTYVTVGGWIVEIIEHNGLLFASERTSPGLLGGKTVAEFTTAGGSGLGWRYYDNGVIMSHGFNHTLWHDLKIIAKYPNNLVDPPAGYVWKGGFPKLEETIEGRHYVDLLNNKLLIRRKQDYDLIDCHHIGKKRIALVASPPQEVWPKYYVHTNITKNWGVIRYDEKQCHFFQIRKNENDISGGPFGWSHDDILESGVWKEVTKEEMVARFNKNPLADTSPAPQPAPTEQYYIAPKGNPWFDSAAIYFVRRYDNWHVYLSHLHKERVDTSEVEWWEKKIKEGRLITCSKEEALAQIGNLPVVKEKVAASPPVPSQVSGPEEEAMSKSTFVSITSSAVSRTIGAANYLYVEPTKIIGGYVKRSLRYFVLAGTVSGIIYGVNDPAALKSRIASVIPKITIEAPSAMR